ncbi:MAG TPA: cytochrome c [Flavipsychrobacter sp.]|nr:cytochrome c [Flavipsychrobacter sp.]
MRKILLILSVVFALYSFAVYAFSDVQRKNKPSDEVTAGWKTWQEKNCQSCHQLYGLGGYMGPDLTNTASDKGKEYMRSFIRYGTGKMPNFHLNEQEVNELLAFLSWVDKSGRSKVADSLVHWTGSYRISKR